VSRDGEMLNFIEFYKDFWRTPGPIIWVSPANGDQAAGGFDFFEAARAINNIILKTQTNAIPCAMQQCNGLLEHRKQLSIHTS
jgi:hypothetical protein